VASVLRKRAACAAVPGACAGRPSCEPRRRAVERRDVLRPLPHRLAPRPAPVSRRARRGGAVRQGERRLRPALRDLARRGRGTGVCALARGFRGHRARRHRRDRGGEGALSPRRALGALGGRCALGLPGEHAVAAPLPRLAGGGRHVAPRPRRGDPDADRAAFGAEGPALHPDALGDVLRRGLHRARLGRHPLRRPHRAFRPLPRPCRLHGGNGGDPDGGSPARADRGSRRRPVARGHPPPPRHDLPLAAPQRARRGLALLHLHLRESPDASAALHRTGMAGGDRGWDAARQHRLVAHARRVAPPADVCHRRHHAGLRGRRRRGAGACRAAWRSDPLPRARGEPRACPGRGLRRRARAERGPARQGAGQRRARANRQHRQYAGATRASRRDRGGRPYRHDAGLRCGPRGRHPRTAGARCRCSSPRACWKACRTSRSSWRSPR
jgi:hypothetical protein